MNYTEIVATLVVALASLLMVMLELVKAFGQDCPSAFCNRYVWILIMLNIGTAGLVYGIVRTSGYGSDKQLLTALIIGFTYPLLLRSRFVYFRAVGKKEDATVATLALKLDEIYATFQEQCLRQTSIYVALRTLQKINKIAKKTPEDEMIRSIQQFLPGLKQLKQVEVHDEFQGRLDEALKIQVGTEIRKLQLARLVNEITDGKPDRLLTNP